jgi:hypothetical protein
MIKFFPRFFYMNRGICAEFGADSVISDSARIQDIANWAQILLCGFVADSVISDSAIRVFRADSALRFPRGISYPTSS